jgi:prepilin-type N-terminal cleavage/methylation domain-containing protein
MVTRIGQGHMMLALERQRLGTGRRLRQAGARSAFTLLELILVLALLVILGAMVYPSLDEMYGNNRLTAGADMVRAAWASARSHALDEGQAYRFAILPGQGNFRVAPDTSQFWGGNKGGTSGPPSAAGDNANASFVLEDVLPKGVRFALPDSGPLGGAPDSGNSNPAPGSVDPGSWHSLATFLPDGTALEDVAIAFQRRGSRPVVLKLRGVTGVVTQSWQDEGPEP